MQPPYFEVGRPDALNYGGLATIGEYLEVVVSCSNAVVVVGHEVCFY